MYQLTHTRTDCKSCRRYALIFLLSLYARISTMTLSTFPLRLSPFSLTFPYACGHVRDVCEQLSRSRFRVGLQERARVIQSENTPVTIPDSTYHLQNSRARWLF